MSKKFIYVLIIFILSIPYNLEASNSKPHTGKLGRHNKAVYVAIKKKLNITDMDIKAARENGVTAFTLAGEKGVMEEELRSFITLEAEKSLNQLQAKGLMPRFVADRIENKVRISIENWDGCFN